MLVMTGAASVNAQVLIGENGTGKPHEGAILELSPSENNLGLLLPNVALGTSPTEFALVLEEGTANFDKVKEEATGMIVYNTTNALDGPGLYVWDGKKWGVLICTPPNLGPITFSTPVITLNEPFTASVPEVTSTTSYVWTLSNGLTGSSTTREIEITPPAVGEYPAGSIKVKAVKACGTNAEQSNTAPFVVSRAAVQDEEGNKYPIGDFGDAGTWMTENLRYKGDLVEKTDYYYPNDDPNVPLKYGLLYTWKAATGRTEVIDTDEGALTPPHNLEICPAGWHVPSVEEWDALISVISADQNELYASLNSTGSAGTKMKSTEWVNSIDSKGKSNASYDNGFDGLLVGTVNLSGEVDHYGEVTHFWASNNKDLTRAYERYLFDTGANMGINNTSHKEHRFSVRCKRDN
ncbi:MAG: hypothetical protein LBH61_05140 [Dysgonamonadaceae bacterium]|nr:hypothetical protein [Dysgonamonadaceae bacterium]